MITTQRIDAIGDREATTLATATTQKVFASLTSHAELPNDRQGVSINNCDSSADLYVRLVAKGTSTPTVSSTNNDAIIPAKANRSIAVSRGLDIWIRSSASGTINYTAVELI